MRILLHMSASTMRQTHCEKLFRLLTNALGDFPDTFLTDNDPDVVHVLGTCDATTCRLLKRANSRLIPTVLSPLGSTMPWNTRHKRMGKNGGQRVIDCISANMLTAIHAASDIEYKMLRDRLDGISKRTGEKPMPTKPCDLFLIRNAVLTNSLNKTEMVGEMRRKYDEIVALFDKDIRNDITQRLESTGEKDEATTLICKKLMYAEYRFKRRSIPETLVNDIAVSLTNNDYNEDMLEEQLQQLGIADFTASLEKIALDRTWLTEGFMPVAWVDNKLTKQIEKNITN